MISIFTHQIGHAIIFRRSLQTRGLIHRVADHGIFHLLARKADIACHHFAGLDAAANGKRLQPLRLPLGTQLFHPLIDGFDAIDCQLGMVGLRQWCAPVSHDAVTDKFVDGTVMLFDHLHHRPQISVEPRHHLLRRMRLAERW